MSARGGDTIAERGIKFESESRRVNEWLMVGRLDDGKAIKRNSSISC